MDALKKSVAAETRAGKWKRRAKPLLQDDSFTAKSQSARFATALEMAAAIELAARTM